MDPNQIVRIEDPTPATLDRCIAEHRPVILTATMRDQIATRRWDLPYLRAKLGARRVQVVHQDSPRVYWHPQAGLPLVSQAFEEFADGVLEGRAPGWSYLQDDVNSFPTIQDDYRLPPMMQQKGIVRGKLWMSGAGLVTPLHYDAVETLHWVIRGSKRFLCYVPGVRRYYPFSWRSTAPFISQIDPDHADLARFPRFCAATPLEFVLHAGEVLYLPAFWWHQVTSVEALNISLNFVWWASWRKSVRHLPQLARAGRHLAIQVRKIRAKVREARAERDPARRAAPT